MEVIVVKIILVLCGIGIFAAGILYFLSYDSYTKDVQRRLEEAEEKESKV